MWYLQSLQQVLPFYKNTVTNFCKQTFHFVVLSIFFAYFCKNVLLNIKVFGKHFKIGHIRQNRRKLSHLETLKPFTNIIPICYLKNIIQPESHIHKDDKLSNSCRVAATLSRVFDQLDQVEEAGVVQKRGKAPTGFVNGRHVTHH